MGKSGSEIAALYFAFYSDCYIEDLTIAIGLTVNSFSGSLSTLATTFIWFLTFLDISDTTGDFYYMDSYATADSVSDFGVLLGGIVTALFNVQVPSAVISY